MKTHNGHIISEPELQRALNRVADDLRVNAQAVRLEDAYASHVTDADKDRYMTQQQMLADEVQSGMHNHAFWLWQRVNTIITGECVALLP